MVGLQSNYGSSQTNQNFQLEIAVIKAVKEACGLGLKEGIKKEETEELKAKLEEAGATVNLK